MRRKGAEKRGKSRHGFKQGGLILLIIAVSFWIVETA